MFLRLRHSLAIEPPDFVRGDAVIRYFQLALFVDSSHLLCLQNDEWKKVFAYVHKESVIDTLACLLDSEMEDMILKLSENLKHLQFY